MPTPIEARRLSGIDVGKTFTVAPDQERTIQGLDQDKHACWIRSTTKDGRRWKNRFDPTETIVITGKPAPATGPDCQANKHPACDGRALDEATDEITRCECACHS